MPRKKPFRTLVATSHDEKFHYFLDSRDRYIYQQRTIDREWVGWLCSLDAWERTFSKAEWMTLVPEAA